MKQLKKIFFLSLFFEVHFCFLSFSQTNLVPNPSFEDTIHCPNSPDEINYCSSWNSYRNSPDYFNFCSIGSVSVPNNWGGFQNAASGHAYSAFATYGGYSNTYREYIGAQLTSNLATGTRYFVSFKINLSLSNSIQANCATDKMGVAFSTVAHNTSNPMPIQNTAKVYSSAIISDTLNWIRIFGSFTSDSNYNFIAIGNFFDNSLTDTLIMDGDTLCRSSYYYIDDVCVSSDSLFCANYSFTGIQEETYSCEIKLMPNPAHDFFTIQATD